jgi:hypothetical protein
MYAQRGEGFWIQEAIARIKLNYGVDVTYKDKSLLKFGQNEVIGTSETTLMTFLGSEISETYIETNLITHVVSDSGSNTGTAVVEGHYIDDGNKIFHIQTVQLTGQTPVALSQPLCRATRVYNSSSTNWAAASKVYVTQANTYSSGVPVTANKVHCIGIAEENTSLKAATTFSYVDYALITQVYFTIDKKTSASTDVKLKIRENGKVFRTSFKRTVSTSAKPDIDFILRPGIIVPANADVILTAIASTTAVSVSGGFNALIFTT